MRRPPHFASVGPAAIAALSVASCLAQSGASYTAQRRIDTITVDGNLNEASWATAADTSVFTLWNGSPAPASLRTTAKMIWDEQYLYIGFSAKDPDVYATYAGRDVHCWEQDAFEVFVTVPGTAGYVEADGSPNGALWDGLFTGVFQGLGGSYNLAQLLIAGHVDGTPNNAGDRDTGFTGEMRVPFSDIYQGVAGGHPVHGTQLRLNLNRVDWNTPPVKGGAGAAGSDTYHAWSPVPGNGISFHRPDKFGTVTFSTNPLPAPAWVIDGGTLSGTNVVIAGSGHPNGTYWVVAAGDPTLGIDAWTRIATNTFAPVTGQFRFTNAIAPDSAQRYFRLRAP
ncbi:MAG: hypothetical protein DVB31_13075 [Verrucomicrobia bacterium]|nr:MAG: hypothetical protein DVB31_13075 [Verrucomicrobiota bacterium]